MAEDYGYGDTNAGYDGSGGGSTQQFTMDYWINNIKARQAEGYPLSDTDRAILANPDDYFISGSGGPTKKNFVNQHQGLLTILAAAAPFIAGGVGAALGGGGAAAPEAVGTIADTSEGLGSAAGAGAADAGSFAGGAAEAATIADPGIAAAGVPSSILAEGAPIFESGTVASPLAAAPAAGGFAPAVPAAAASAAPAAAAADPTADYPYLKYGPDQPASTTGAPSYKQIADLIKGIGTGIGGADTASQNNAVARARAQLAAAQGEENAYLSDAELEAQQRKSELADVYRESALGGHSPYDPAPPQASPQYASTVKALADQGAGNLATAPIYGIKNIPKPTDIYPDPTKVGQETTLQKVGDWLSPALTIAGSVPPSIYSKIFSWL